MQPRSMMPVNDKRAAFSNDFCRGRLRRFIETPFPGILFELSGRFVGPGRLKTLPGGLRPFAFRMKGRRIRGNRFPRVSVLRDALRDAVQIERLWTLTQLFPM